MIFDYIIIGGGIAGISAAANLTDKGSVLLLEKNKNLGGLIGGFSQEGFYFDYGIRALENAGTLFPFLKQLNIDIEMVKNPISIGYEDYILELSKDHTIKDLKRLLLHTFPDSEKDIDIILKDIEKIMSYSNILYGIDNPLFIDYKSDPALLKDLFPWMAKYLTTIGKIEKLKTPVYDFLKQRTNNIPLIDLIAQHFFDNSSAFFALSYYQMYMDYYYPTGGTKAFITHLRDYLLDHGCVIHTDSEVTQINPQKKEIIDHSGTIYSYKKLIWAADLSQFYRVLDLEGLNKNLTYKNVQRLKSKVLNASGNQSLLTLFIALDMPTSKINDTFGPHCFYTPSKEGLSCFDGFNLDQKPNQTTFLNRVERYLELTTYEISCPAVRDNSLAPINQSGLVISTVFDFDITHYAKDYYENFKTFVTDTVVGVLDKSILPGLKEAIIFTRTATPLTLYKHFNNKNGAITGWSFNDKAPVTEKFIKIAKSVDTPLKDIYQAGHWTFSPSGLPTAIITGKIAADKAQK